MLFRKSSISSPSYIMPIVAPPPPPPPPPQSVVDAIKMHLFNLEKESSRAAELDSQVAELQDLVESLTMQLWTQEVL